MWLSLPGKISPVADVWFQEPSKSVLEDAYFNSEIRIGVDDYVYIKVDGDWQKVAPYAKIAGIWRKAKPYVKVNGVWRRGVLPSTPNIEFVSSGTVEYSSGNESVNFVLPLNSGAAQNVIGGDVLVMCITSATSDVTFTPPGLDNILTPTPISSHPDGNYSGVVIVGAVPESRPDSLTASWNTPTPQRGTLAWAAFRNVNVEAAVENSYSSGWVLSGASSKDAPEINTTVQNAYILAVVEQPSGSAVITPPAGWSQRTDATQRDGHISTKGIQENAGIVPAATFGVSNTHVHRLTQIALRPKT